MPRYSFSLEDGTERTSPDGPEDFADNEAAMQEAWKIARNFAGSTITTGRWRVVVRNEAGNEIGDVPLLNTIT